MNTTLHAILIARARALLRQDDPSHDVAHTLRVLALAEQVAEVEHADMDIIVPAALFHDVVNYPKNDPRTKDATDESANSARQLLQEIPDYPQAKTEAVVDAIRMCSFSKGLVPELLEAKILQDADRLEATGAIAIMRTFASSGIMQRPFYDTLDPFCDHRTPDDSRYALDLFFTRLLQVGERMHTTHARTLAQRRTRFLHQFLEELRAELHEAEVPS